MHEAKADALAKEAERIEETQFRTKLEHVSKGIKHISNILNATSAKPLLLVRKEGTSQHEQSFVNDPKEVDATIRNDWGRIYKGNVKDVHESAVSFVRKYAKFLFRDSEFDIPPLSMQDIKDECQNCSKSSHGPDGLEPAEMALFSDDVYDAIAKLLNIIENGATWPEGIVKARAAFLEKDHTKRGEPAAQRVLLMCPALYRRWAGARLTTLQAWVRKWAHEAIFAGALPKEADDAWMELAIEIEHKQMEETPFCGWGSRYLQIL